MAPSGLPPAIVAAVLWALIFVSVRPAFAGLFQRGCRHKPDGVDLLETLLK
jgi:hypothetical protein